MMTTQIAEALTCTENNSSRWADDLERMQAIMTTVSVQHAHAARTKQIQQLSSNRQALHSLPRPRIHVQGGHHNLLR